MKILILAYAYPPASSPRAYRWGAIVEQLARQGHQVDVICTWRTGLPREEATGEVGVFRVGARLAERTRNGLVNHSSTNGGAPGSSNAARGLQRRAPGMRKYLSAVCRKVWSQLHWPDFQCFHMLPAYHAGKKMLARQDYDAMISVSLPFSCHVAGLLLKRRHPDLHWVVDIGDPFAFQHELPLNNRRLYGRLNHFVEAAVLAAADRIAVTTQGALDKYLEVFRMDADKISVIPPLLSISRQTLMPESPRMTATSKRPIRMVYCGQLYRNIRSPAYLLKLMRELSRDTENAGACELHFYGNTEEHRDTFELHGELLDKRVFLHGQVDRAEAAAAVREADLLVNIGNTTSHQLPSKIVEYMAAGKPILNLVSHDRDCTLQFLEDYPAVLNLFCERDSLDGNLLRTSQFLERLPIPISSKQIDKLRAPFMPEVIAKQYAELAESGKARSSGGGSGYLVFRWRGMPVISVPRSPDWLAKAALRRYIPPSFGRRIYRRVMLAALSICNPARLAAAQASPLPPPTDFEFVGFLNHLRRLLDNEDLHLVITHPSELGRGRFYVSLLSPDGVRKAFVKVIGPDGFEQFEFQERSVADVLHSRRPLGFRYPKILHAGQYQGVRFQIFEPLPPRCRPVSDCWVKRPGQIAASLAAGTRRRATLKDLSWWKDFQRQREQAGPLYDQIRQWVDQPVDVCLAHGDFHRANLCVDRDSIWVFDWEHWAADAPILVDEVRFFLGDHTRELMKYPKMVLRKLIARFLPSTDSQRADSQQYERVSLAIAYLVARRNMAGVQCAVNWPPLKNITEKKMDSYRNRFMRPEDAEKYDNGVYSGNSVHDLLWDTERPVIEKLVERFRAEHDRVEYLDFACGTGRIISLVEKYVDSATGIDISPEMLKLASRKAKSAAFFCRDITGDTEASEERYDLITSFRFLTNAETELRRSVLPRLTERLRGKDSLLLINIHGNLLSYKILLAPYHWLGNTLIKRRQPQSQCLTRGRVLSELREAGLKVEKVIGLGFVSGKLLPFMPYRLALWIERKLAGLPLLQRFGVNLLFVCRKAASAEKERNVPVSPCRSETRMPSASENRAA